MEFKRSGERVAVMLVCAAILALVASLLLAPMVVPGMCVDSTEPGQSYCTELPAQTLLGAQAHVGVWLASLAAIAAATVALLFWPRGRGRG